ncbi:MAG: pyridoxal-phosphate dependent enzyme, partial [Myxococcota bacterium]
KTGAFEVCDALGGPPDVLAIPVGNAGNITAYWRGFKAYHDDGHIDRLPRMWGFQAAGAAPIVDDRVILEPKTLATAIKIGNPASWRLATDARDSSGGQIQKVTDDEIVEAYTMLARMEGVFCEPASAASVAGLIKTARSGADMTGIKRIVCVLTGHGLKDPDMALASSPSPTVLPATYPEVEQHILKVIA